MNSTQLEINVPSINMEPHLLISSVRQTYLRFITQLVCQNYVSWCGEKPPPAAFQCAKYLELRSAAQSMVVPLYRQAVLNIVKSIKQSSCCKQLYPELEQCCLENQFHNKGVQTDPIQESFTQAQKSINSSKKEEEDKTQVENKNIVNHSDDHVMAAMEKLFECASVDNDEDIFDSLPCDSHEVQMIMDDLNKYVSISSSSQKQLVDEEKCNNEGIKVDTLEKINVNPIGCSIVSSSQHPQTEKYLYSPWPCEVFYQKKMLREKLDNICEKSIKKHLKVKQRFVELFGYDSDDEQGLQSPDISTDFLRSCRQRTAPLLTKHLRKFIDKVKVPKHLAKPLAKHLLYRLVDYNQYPSDYECYLFIKEYFKAHPHIKCLADL